ncbi:MAG: hypothetical protein EPO24_11740 [Bacteroidetes bacterium]|nr:MAG: hypothetical protein EPO24_11740 [Bacteroidota bacterium]
MAKKNPFIALLTDFGAADAYVGIMKGVIYSINPQARIIDVSHESAPQQIDQAAFLLWSAYKYFPAGTIFVCIVDPGVGSLRKIFCVQTSNYTFLVPDNGMLKFVLGETQVKGVYDVSKPKIFSHPVSATFHGRDIFAPLAARLSMGEKPSVFGRPAKASLNVELLVSVHPKRVMKYEGKVIHIDRFGNIVTNLLLPESRLPKFRCLLEKKTIEQQVLYYAENDSGDLIIVRGSSGLLEISIRNGSAATATRAKLGQRVTLELLSNEKDDHA